LRDIRQGFKKVITAQSSKNIELQSVLNSKVEKIKESTFRLTKRGARKRAFRRNIESQEKKTREQIVKIDAKYSQTKNEEYISEFTSTTTTKKPSLSESNISLQTKYLLNNVAGFNYSAQHTDLNPARDTINKFLGR
jgi:hypothetical protein